jgi:hypothetical protein
MTVTLPETEPRRPILIMSPIASGLVGSPSTQASQLSPRSIAHFRSLIVPLIAGPSSSPVIRKEIEPFGGPFLSMWRATAAAKHAIPPFMSTAPRPYIMPPAISAENGGCDQAASSPVGTTSVWPANIRCGPCPPSRA